MSHPVTAPAIPGDLAAPRIDSFKGIDNRNRPTVLGLAWQTEAKNVLCDRAGFLVCRPGMQTVRTGIKDLFATHAGRLLWVDDQDQLLDGENQTVLSAGFFGSPFSWAELETAVLALSPHSGWIIYPDRTVPWGIPQGSAPQASLLDGGHLTPGRRLIACVLQAQDGRIGGTDALTIINIAKGQSLGVRVPVVSSYRSRIYLSPPDAESLYLYATLKENETTIVIDHEPMDLAFPLNTLNLYPPPLGDRVGAWGTRAVVACWEPEQDRSTLYFSRPLDPHLFDLAVDFQMIAGQVRAVRALPAGLMVATDREIVLIAPDWSRQRLWAAGAPLSDASPGIDHEWLWAQTGLFNPLTGESPSLSAFVPQARRAAAVALWHHQGDVYLIATTYGALDVHPIVMRSPITPSIVHP